MLGAKEMILLGTKGIGTFLPKESRKTAACVSGGAEKSRIITNTSKKNFTVKWGLNCAIVIYYRIPKVMKVSRDDLTGVL